MATSTIATLKLTTSKKGMSVTPIQQRRNKMSKRLWEQIQLAKSQATGAAFTPTKLRTIKDADTGVRRQIEHPKRVKPWWFTSENGKTAVCVRYGARVLELAKGKFAVELPAHAQLVATLELIKTAIEAGELDTELESTAHTLRNGFKR